MSYRRMLYSGALQFVKPLVFISRKAPAEIKKIANHHAMLSGVVSQNGKRSYIGSVDENTSFRTASLTKLVTTLGVMKLGLDLDTPIASYTGLPLKSITLRQLLSHTSPLCDGEAYENSLTAPLDLNQLLQSPNVWRKKNTFRYSNLGFGIVGSVVEMVTNESLESWMQKNVFSPLQMTCTYDITTITPKDIYRLVPPKKAFDANKRKAQASPILRPDPQRHYHLSSGNLYANVSDLEKVLDVIVKNDGSFITKDAVKEMKTPHGEYGSLSPNLAYGLGLLIVRGKQTLYGHQGFAYGCVNGMFFSESGDTLVSLNNGANELRDGRLGVLNRDLIERCFQWTL